MFEGTVGIVNVSVKNQPPVGLHVSELDWHGFDRAIEDARVVDVVPGVEEGTRAIKPLELVLPKLPCVSIKKVHEGGVAWPRLSKQSLVFLVAHKYIFGIAFLPLTLLKGHAISIDEVVVIGIDVGVNDCDESATRLADLILHLLHGVD